MPPWVLPLVILAFAVLYAMGSNAAEKGRRQSRTEDGRRATRLRMRCDGELQRSKDAHYKGQVERTLEAAKLLREWI